MFKSQSNHRHGSGPPGVVTEAQTVKNLLAVQETQLRSLEKEMTTHTSILAWGIPWTEKPGGILWGHKELDMTVNFQMFKMVLEKAEEPEIKLPTSAGSSKKQESSRKTSISALLTMPKPSTVWITINCGKF